MGMHLVVGVDGSEHSRRALDLARDMARKMDGALTLVSTYEMPTFPIQDYGLTAERVRQQELERIHDMLLSLAEEMRDVPVTTVLETGDPAEVLCRLAVERGADLVVVGSRGLGRFRAMLVGSVSRRVVEMSSKPVLVVRE
ncbi:MAG: universal stress protein [Myxococcota bacterium]